MGCLWTGPIAMPIPQRHLSLHQTACVPHKFLCVHACRTHPYQIYAALVCMFVNTPTSGWGIPLYTHPVLFVFLSHGPRSTSVYVSCASKHACPPEFVHTCLRECGCVSACIYMGCLCRSWQTVKGQRKNYFGFLGRVVSDAII